MLRGIIFVTTIAVVESLCEPWCDNPCSDLNGDVTKECADCTATSMCHPGAQDFVTAAADRQPAAGSRYGGMGQSQNPEVASDTSEAFEVNSHGRPIQQPKAYVEDWEIGVCDLEKIHHSKLTREFILKAKAPFIVVGLTDTWNARNTWAKEELLRLHGKEPYHLHREGNGTLEELLEWKGKYHMGHAVYPPNGCYSDPWRPYSPMLFDAFADDYSVPQYFTPMSTFQMGVGSGYGIGVPPENHPSSWFAAMKGRKRWVMNPPEAGTGRSGGPGSEPPEVRPHASVPISGLYPHPVCTHIRSWQLLCANPTGPSPHCHPSSPSAM